MTITFSTIPAENFSPMNFTELGEPSGSVELSLPTLVLGLRRSTGSAPADKVVQLFGEADIKGKLGIDSIAAEAAAAYRNVDKFGELFAIGVPENAAGTAATGNIAHAGTATASGTYSWYAGGKLYSVAVLVGETAAQVATKHVAAVTADVEAKAACVLATAQANYTAELKGVHGNDLLLKVIEIPAGLTATATAMSGGLLSEDFSNAIGALGDRHWRRVIVCTSDLTEIARIETELARRFGPGIGQYGQGFVGVRGSVGALGTWATNRNSYHLAPVSSQSSPTNPWVTAAEMAANDAILQDVSLSRFGGALPRTVAPDDSDRWDLTTRNSVLKLGVSTFRVNGAGVAIVDRIVTSYTQNSASVTDYTYQSIETMNVIDLWVRTLAVLSLAWLKRKLLDDDAAVGPGVRVIKPSIATAEILGAYETLALAGHVENVAGFEQGLLVERDATDRNRLNDQHTIYVAGIPVTIAHLINTQK